MCFKKKKPAAPVLPPSGSAAAIQPDLNVAERNEKRASSAGSYFSGAQYGSAVAGNGGFRISLFQKA